MFVHGQETIPDFGGGLRDWLEGTLELHKPRLLIVDPISYLYVLKKTGSQFEETKDMLFPLQWLGKMYQCAIVCLDHRRKRSREDVSMVDTLYGSVAKQAVPSGIIMVNRDQNDIELDMTIRNGQQQKEYVSFTFESGRCFLEYKGGEAQPMNQSDLRMRLARCLAGISGALDYCRVADCPQCAGHADKSVKSLANPVSLHEITRNREDLPREICQQH